MHATIAIFGCLLQTNEQILTKLISISKNLFLAFLPLVVLKNDPPRMILNSDEKL